jgi:hypothetical protein
MQWTPKIHHLYSKKTRIQIATIMKLALKGTQLGRLPKEILLIVCGYVGFPGMPQTVKRKPAKKKQKK